MCASGLFLVETLLGVKGENAHDAKQVEEQIVEGVELGKGVLYSANIVEILHILISRLDRIVTHHLIYKEDQDLDQNCLQQKLAHMNA